jgi:hypothetical protein
MGPARVPHAPLGEGKAGLLEKAFAAATEAGLA